MCAPEGCGDAPSPFRPQNFDTHRHPFRATNAGKPAALVACLCPPASVVSAAARYLVELPTHDNRDELCRKDLPGNSCRRHPKLTMRTEADKRADRLPDRFGSG